MTKQWRKGDVVNPEYYDKCVKLCEFRYMARYPQEFGKTIPPMAPITTPSNVHISGCFGSRKKEGWYYMSQSHVDIFNKYNIPPYEEEKKTIISVIGGLFK